MWESQVLLTDGKVVTFDDWSAWYMWNIFERAIKPKSKEKKKTINKILVKLIQVKSANYYGSYGLYSTSFFAKCLFPGEDSLLAGVFVSYLHISSLLLIFPIIFKSPVSLCIFEYLSRKRFIVCHGINLGKNTHLIKYSYVHGPATIKAKIQCFNYFRKRIYENFKQKINYKNFIFICFVSLSHE